MDVDVAVTHDNALLLSGARLSWRAEHAGAGAAEGEGNEAVADEAGASRESMTNTTTTPAREEWRSIDLSISLQEEGAAFTDEEVHAAAVLERSMRDTDCKVLDALKARNDLEAFLYAAQSALRDHKERASSPTAESDGSTWGRALGGMSPSALSTFERQLNRAARDMESAQVVQSEDLDADVYTQQMEKLQGLLHATASADAAVPDAAA